MSGVTVRGGATAEEVGAILAVLSRAGGEIREPDGYELWRRNRIRIVRTESAEPRLRTNR